MIFFDKADLVRVSEVDVVISHFDRHLFWAVLCLLKLHPMVKLFEEKQHDDDDNDGDDDDDDDGTVMMVDLYAVGGGEDD